MNKISVQNPEIQVHFIRASKLQHNQQQQHKLQIQMLRVMAADKRATIQPVLNMSKQELCHFFHHFQTIHHSQSSFPALADLSGLKLIKNNNRIYFGQVDGRQMMGFGVYYSENKIYEGHFQANRRQGPGCEIYQNGNLYVGSFVNNKKHGSGTFYWFSQVEGSKQGLTQIYEGQWWGGLPDGKGTMRKSNGDVYMGTFKNGLKHGFGSEQFSNGDHYKGQYANGLPEGIGQYRWRDGSCYNGDFKQGMRSGYGCWKLKQAELTDKYEGHYCMDMKSGYGQYSWSNGWTYKGNFDNDKRQGYGELFNQNQCVYRGQWKKGVRIQSSTLNRFNQSKLQLKNSMTHGQQQEEEVEIQDLSRSIKVGKEENIQVEHKLLPRPGSLVHRSRQVKTSREKGVESRVNNWHHKESQSTLSSRVGTEIHRPICRGHSSMGGRVRQ